MKKDYDSFMKDVLAELAVQLGESCHAVEQQTVGNNGTVRREAVISDGIHNVSPCICMDRYYEIYREPDDIRMIASAVAGQYRKHRQDDTDVQWFTDWTEARDRIVFRVTGTKGNEGMFAEALHRDIPRLGLSLVFRAIVDAGPDAAASIQVCGRHLKMWGVSEERILEYAWKNTPLLMKPVMKSMRKILYGELCGVEILGLPPVYVLSNEQKLYGAGCIFYEGVLEQAAAGFGSGFYVLPSSVHEVMLLLSAGPDRKEAAELKEMVAGINRSGVLRAEDVLADEVYYYDMEKQELAVAGLTE